MRQAVALIFVALVGSVVSLAIRRPRLDVSQYDDDFARYKMFSFAAAAYADKPSLCLNSAYPNEGNNSISRVIEVVCDKTKTDSCRGFTAISHSDKAIIISFRGTDAFLQYIQEAVDTIAPAESFIAGGYVSSYFYNAFLAVWNGGLKDDFLTLRNQNPDYEVWVTGHSLGGAMASLCASSLVHVGFAIPEKVKLVTFGQPRVGDKIYAAVHDALVPYSFRVVHNRDLVPHFPPENLPAHYLLDGYFHHKAEVFYENAMKVGDSYTVCNSHDESSKCSDGLLFTLSLLDHFRYFETQETVQDYGEDGCPRGTVGT
uniref:Lipase_3 domain-containing protein n=1 Tax=Steinernema glaseri TaxID=37863 RepID=A0A1I7ZDG5_9BILA